MKNSGIAQMKKMWTFLLNHFYSFEENIIFSEKIWIQTLIIGLYKLSLDLVYIGIVQPTYAYTGYENNFDFLKYMTAWLVCLFAIPFMIKIYKQSTPSSFVITIINVLYFIPMLTIYPFNHVSLWFFLAFTLFWFILLVLQVKFPIIVLKRPMVKPKIISYTVNIIVVLLLAFFIYISYRYTGFHIQLSLFDVYDQRLLARDFTLSTLEGYIIAVAPMLVCILMPLVLERKKYVLFGMLVVTAVLNFSFAGSKFVVFSYLAAFLGFFLFRKNRVQWFVPGMIIVNVIVTFERFILNSWYISSIMHDRLSLGMAKLSLEYFEFFSEQPLNIYREGLLGRFGLENNYTAPLGYILGQNKDPDLNVNHGLFGDAFANLGYAGVLVLPIILIIILRILDSAAYHVDKKAMIAPSLLIAMMYINSTWSTVFLTGGLLLACVCFYLYPTKAKQE